MSTTANYLKEIKVPQNYSEYYEELSQQVYKEFETAADAKINAFRFFWNNRAENRI